MSKLTKAQLAAENAALREELRTLRENLAPRTEPAAPRTEGLPTWRVERRAQLARAKAEAARSGHWVKA